MWCNFYSIWWLMLVLKVPSHVIVNVRQCSKWTWIDLPGSAQWCTCGCVWDDMYCCQLQKYAILYSRWALSLYLCSVSHVGFFWSGGRLCLVSWLNICPVCLSSEERQEKTLSECIWMFSTPTKSVCTVCYIARESIERYSDLSIDQSPVGAPLSWFKRLEDPPPQEHLDGGVTMSLLKPFIYFYYTGSERRAGI